MPDSSIQCIEKDGNGIIWIGTQAGGLVRLDESQFTNIHDITFEPQPVIYPVPVKNQLTVFYPNSKFTEIELADITGKHLNIIFDKPSADFYTTHLSSLSAGIYFLQMKTVDGKIMTRKIIK